MKVWVDMDISYNDPGYNTARGYGIVANSTPVYSFSAPDNDTWINWQTAYQWGKYISYSTGTDGTTWDDITAAPYMKEFTVDISNWNGWQYIGVVGACSYSNHIRTRFRRIVLS